MAREYSEKSFLLEIDDYSLVEQYLRGRKITSFSYSKDKKTKQDNEAAVEQIEGVLHAQPDEIQKEIERDFQHISNLSNEKGSQNLMAEATAKSVQLPIQQFTEMNPYDRALWFFNQHHDVFDEADAVQQFYDLNGWKRVPIPSKPIEFVLRKKDELATALKKYYEEKEARGKYGDVEMYPKGDRVYIVARLTDHAESDFVPDEKTGRLKKKGTRRPPFEIYYLYRLDEGEENGGELEIKARGGWQKQRDLLGVFAEAVFNHQLDDSKQTFNLELLKNENFTMVADPQDQMEWWWLKALELRTPDRLARIKITVGDNGKKGAQAMWDQLRRLHLDDTIGTMLINSADIQMKFKPTRKRQKGTATFYINWKDSCSLNSIDEFNVKARAILKKSKLDCGFDN
jgi:hypothetical protein